MPPMTTASTDQPATAFRIQMVPGCPAADWLVCAWFFETDPVRKSVMLDELRIHISECGCGKAGR